MLGKAITFISIKGGVGKTTISVNVAQELAERMVGSDRVLIIDLDAQAGSSLYVLGYDRLKRLEKEGKTLYHLIDRLMRAKPGEEKNDVLDYTVPAEGSWSPMLHILPGSARILEVEREFLAKSGLWLLRLRSIVEELKARGYRYIFVDPPASFTTLSRAALAACDYFLIPIIPDEFGLNALEFFRSEVFSSTVYELAIARGSLKSSLELPLCGGIFFNRVESGTRGAFHERMMQRIIREAENIKLYGSFRIPVYKSYLRDYIAYPKAVEKHVPIKRLGKDESKKALEDLKSFFEEFYEYVIKDRARELK